MKHRDKSVEEFVLRHMGLFKAPQQEMDLAEARIQNRLRSVAAGVTGELPVVSRVVGQRWKFRPLALAFGATTATIILVIFLQMPPGIDALGVVESADGSVSQVSGGKIQVVRTGEGIEPGQVLRTNHANGLIRLADGSGMELRSQSEFSLERAEDGIRIRLFQGGLIMTAVRQPAGHLYVQTKDVSVSVVGTIFLVNAEEEGSRVAVIEGEVHVQQGTTLKKLLSGEQVATGLSVETIPVAEEISWSRNAPTHLALLQQELASAPLSPPSPQNEAQPNPTQSFEVASIRRNDDPTCRRFLCGITTQPRSGRLIIQNQTLLSIVRTAYGVRTEDILGGPNWRDKDKFDIEAKAESPVAEEAALFVMLRSLLADRFKLIIHRETREMPTYTLHVGRNGPKMERAPEENAAQIPARASGAGGRGGCSAGLGIGAVGSLQRLGDPVSYAAGIRRFGGQASMSELANFLTALVGCRPVLDRTELPGIFGIQVEWVLSPHTEFRVPGLPDPEMGPALEDQLGLKLEMQKALGQVLVIDSAEQPSEN